MLNTIKINGLQAQGDGLANRPPYYCFSGGGLLDNRFGLSPIELVPDIYRTPKIPHPKNRLLQRGNNA